MAPSAETTARRWQLVLAYQRLGSYVEAAKVCKSDRTQVHKWVKRYEATGGVDDLPRAGRPRAPLASEDAMRVLTSGLRQGLASPALAQRIESELGEKTTPRTVQRFLNAYMAKQRRVRKVPALTPAHKAARLEFAKRWLHKKWDNVVVTDSKYFWLCPKGCGPKVWVMFGERPPTYQVR